MDRSYVSNSKTFLPMLLLNLDRVQGEKNTQQLVALMYLNFFHFLLHSLHHANAVHVLLFVSSFWQRFKKVECRNGTQW